MKASERHQDTSSVALPGQAVTRENAAGWQRWRLTRHEFTPAPRLSLAAYRRLSPQRRMVHDLHRAATHANLVIQETPMSAAVSRVMWSRIQNNALKRTPATRAGLMINGGGYQGKTETACEVAAAFEDQWLTLHEQLNPHAIPGTRDMMATIAYAQTPVTATPKSICQAILDFYGADHPKRMTLPQLVHAVRTSLYDHCTKVLLLDDVTRLKMHREADQDALDLVRSLMSMHVTLVLIGVGIPDSGLLSEGRHSRRGGQWIFPRHRATGHHDEAATQTERRFDLVDLDPFRYDTPADIAAWADHLAGVEAQLRLFQAKPGMLTDGGMPEYLFRRTGGIVGLLERLVEDGCARAIETGTECLTSALFDDIEIDLGNVAGRDPRAGEIPEVPPRRATAASRPAGKGKSRNTVFDDAGSPATSVQKPTGTSRR